MNKYLAVAIINVALIILIGFGIYYTHSLWCLLGLLFLFGASKDDNIEPYLQIENKDKKED